MSRGNRLFSVPPLIVWRVPTGLLGAAREASVVRDLGADVDVVVWTSIRGGNGAFTDKAARRASLLVNFGFDDLFEPSTLLGCNGTLDVAEACSVFSEATEPCVGRDEAASTRVSSVLKNEGSKSGSSKSEEAIEQRKIGNNNLYR